MPCYYPIEAWYSKSVNDSGKRPLVFQKSQALQPDQSYQLPCGRCIGCRLERSRQWATRCMHEAQLYENNCFLTLTFDDDHLWSRENPGSIDKTEFQKFIKRLRKHCGKNRIKYYGCGEYGDENGRPHYHALIFGYDFPDKIHFKNNGDHRYYISETLQNLWRSGHCIIGNLDFDSAAYVARYALKKVNGDKKDEHYVWTDPETGELRKRDPESAWMSRNLGQRFFNRYLKDIYPSDEIIANGHPQKPPKAYLRYLEKEDPFLFDQVKENRSLIGFEQAVYENSTTERLIVREKCKKAQLNNLVRGM